MGIIKIIKIKCFYNLVDIYPNHLIKIIDLKIAISVYSYFIKRSLKIKISWTVFLIKK